MGYGQEMDGCGKFMKFSMFVANFIIFVSKLKSVLISLICYFLILFMKVGGCIVLGLGIWTLVDKSFVTELLGTNLFLGAAYTLVATGAAVCLVSFLGCVGSVREVRCMLLTVNIQIMLPLNIKSFQLMIGDKLKKFRQYTSVLCNLHTVLHHRVCCLCDNDVGRNSGLRIS